jgi:hypothetical protein
VSERFLSWIAKNGYMDKKIGERDARMGKGMHG